MVKEAVKVVSANRLEASNYGLVIAKHTTYERTFRINSRKIIQEWHRKHPESKVAVIDIAAYGFAIQSLLQSLPPEVGKYVYGLSVGQGLYGTFDHGDRMVGDMGDFISDDGGKAKQAIVQWLSKNNCEEGAALIYMRPVFGYTVTEKEYDIDPGPEYDKFYLNMFAGISKYLLAPDGTFVVELPPHIAMLDTVDKENFAKKLQERLGTSFVVTKPYTGKWQFFKPPEGGSHFTSIHITRKK